MKYRCEIRLFSRFFTSNNRAAIIRQAHDPEFIEGHGAAPTGAKKNQKNLFQAGLIRSPIFP
jgi:hypothetical protein